MLNYTIIKDVKLLICRWKGLERCYLLVIFSKTSVEYLQMIKKKTTSHFWGDCFPKYHKRIEKYYIKFYMFWILRYYSKKLPVHYCYRIS